MPNLDVVAVITAKSGSEATLEGALRELAGASKGDQGCLAYDLYVSESSPGTFITIEKWESQEDIDAHMAGPHIAKLITVAGDHFEGIPAIHNLRALES